MTLPHCAKCRPQRIDPLHQKTLSRPLGQPQREGPGRPRDPGAPIVSDGPLSV
jgi:hypothetical protein